MIDHRHCLILTATAIDFALAPEEQAELDDHLAACSACRSASNQLRAQAVELRERPRAMPPASMRDGVAIVWSSAGRRPLDDLALRMILVLVAVLLAVVGIAVVGTGVHRPIDAVVPTDVPGPTVPAAGSAPLPRIGTEAVFHVLAGPTVGSRECTVIFASGCASDTIAAFGSIWTTATDSVVRVDPETGVVRRYIAVDGFPLRMVEADGALWVTVGEAATVVRIDPATDTVTASVRIGGLPAGLAATGGSLWVADAASKAIVRVDPTTATVQATIELSVTPWALAATSDAVWATDRYAEHLVRIDPRDATVVATLDVPGVDQGSAWDYGAGVVTAGDRVWIASGAQVASYDPVAGTFARAVTPTFPHVSAASEALWLVSASTQILQRLDPDSLERVAQQRVPVSAPISSSDWEVSIAVTGDKIWLRSYPSGTLVRVSIEPLASAAP